MKAELEALQVASQSYADAKQHSELDQMPSTDTLEVAFSGNRST